MQRHDKKRVQRRLTSSQENTVVGAEVDFKDPEPGIHRAIKLDIDLQPVRGLDAGEELSAEQVEFLRSGPSAGTREAATRVRPGVDATSSAPDTESSPTRQVRFPP
ncbi:hypothetical protein INR49_009564 [Caranx melampygus]|nr:hypothetical protein INR49_009564 [Caranx melampygus]